jgi:hypothetical protein
VLLNEKMEAAESREGNETKRGLSLTLPEERSMAVIGSCEDTRQKRAFGQGTEFQDLCACIVAEFDALVQQCDATTSIVMIAA